MRIHCVPGTPRCFIDGVFRATGKADWKTSFRYGLFAITLATSTAGPKSESVLTMMATSYRCSYLAWIQDRSLVSQGGTLLLIIAKAATVDVKQLNI